MQSLDLDPRVFTALAKFVFMSFKLHYRYVRHYVCMTDKPPWLSSVKKINIIFNNWSMSAYK